MDNGTNESALSESSYIYSYVFLATNTVSVLVCVLAAILVAGLKLYRKVVYRLALYQVLASLALSSAGLLQIIFINYNGNPGVYHSLCVMVGFLQLYSQWMKLLFTMWVTFHLFCFAVLYKNLKKLEALYISTSVLVPALIAAVPLITKTYGPRSPVYICYINANPKFSTPERFALWDGPAIVILLVSSITMVAMVINLAHKMFCGLKYEPIVQGGHYWKALKQLLPLAAFPIIFFFFELPVFAFHIYLVFMQRDNSSVPNMGIQMSDLVFFSQWGTASGGTVLLHICVVWYLKRRRLLKTSALLHPPT